MSLIQSYYRNFVQNLKIHFLIAGLLALRTHTFVIKLDQIIDACITPMKNRKQTVTNVKCQNMYLVSLNSPEMP